MATRKNNSENQAILWLGQEHLFLGLPSEIDGFIFHQVRWNPSRFDMQATEASDQLTAALVGISKQFSLNRMNVRLCLDDGLCVTRVVTGDPEEVARELDAIRNRSQLYLSLGLGEKLTGSLSVIRENQSEYALTSIVNQRTLQAIYGAITNARLKLVSIEPVTLSVTRAIGLLGLDKDEPVLFVSIDDNRCDLAITRSGQLMLSYRISGVKKPADIAMQIESNLTRLRRFCERVRGQGDSILQSIYIFGDPKCVEALSNSMKSAQSKIHVASVAIPESIRVKATEETSPVVVLALWAASQWNENRKDCLPAPDLLAQLQQLQRKSLPERLVKHFFPSAIAAGLMMVVCGLYLNDYRKLAAKKRECASITSNVSIAESEIAEWESKQRLIGAYERLDGELAATSWTQLIVDLAPCLPDNARLDNLSLNDDRTVTLRGTMVARDQTYEMLAAIKQLPNVVDVSLESVNSVGSSSQIQFQFEVKFQMSSVTTDSTKSKPHPQIASN